MPLDAFGWTPGELTLAFRSWIAALMEGLGAHALELSLALSPAHVERYTRSPLGKLRFCA